MNQYGQMARDHWAKYRPTEYRAMTDQETFFSALGGEIETRIDARADDLEQLVPVDQPYQERLAQMTAARPTAEQEVLAEMLPPAEEDETEE